MKKTKKPVVHKIKVNEDKPLLDEIQFLYDFAMHTRSNCNHNTLALVLKLYENIFWLNLKLYFIWI